MIKKLMLPLLLGALLAGCTPAAPAETTAPASVPETTQEALPPASQAAEPETTVSMTEALSQVTQETLPLSYDAYQVVYNITTEGGEEAGTFQGIGPEGKLLWTYETGSYPMAQLERITPAGRFQEKYYLIENGTVVALDIPTGRVLFENSEFQGSPCKDAIVIDEYGYLYLSGYDSPDFFAMDPQGHTVRRISSLDESYCMPYKITLEGDMLTVHMESDGAGNSGDFPCTLEMDWLPQAKG